MSFTLFVCHDASEEAWIAALCAAQDREQLAHERDELIEENLRLDTIDLHAANDDGADPDEYVPFYSDRPYVVVHPQVFRR